MKTYRIELKISEKYPIVKIYQFNCTSAGVAINRAIKKFRKEKKRRIYSLTVKCDLLKMPKVKPIIAESIEKPTIENIKENKENLTKNDINDYLSQF